MGGGVYVLVVLRGGGGGGGGGEGRWTTLTKQGGSLRPGLRGDRRP